MARDKKPSEPVVRTYEGPIHRHWGQAFGGRFNPPAPPKIVTTPEPVYRSTLATDKVEHELLVAIRARPDDEQTRAVYADWLEQHGHATRAKFVRDEELRIKSIVKESTAKWRAITSRAVIQMCEEEACPRRWHLLEPTLDENVRRCDECSQNVRFLTRDKTGEDGMVGCHWRGEQWVLDVDWHD